VTATVTDLGRERRIRAAVAELAELARNAQPDDPGGWVDGCLALAAREVPMVRQNTAIRLSEATRERLDRLVETYNADAERSLASSATRSSIHRAALDLGLAELERRLQAGSDQ
jgi:hypothetical protein